MALARDLNQVFNTLTGTVEAKNAKTASGASAWMAIGDAQLLTVQLHSDAGAGTTPTLDVKFQTSFDGTDGTAVDIPSGAFTQVVGVASNQIKQLSVFHKYVKAIWTITGTTPSFNFGVYLTSSGVSNL